ncbi:MAG: hypothetical protein JWN64_511 [Parcubacteria group bacterium]|nr:hypothetical protein [Parcubacteria group bacterium]
MIRNSFIRFLITLVVLVLVVTTYGAWFAVVGKASAEAAGLRQAIETKQQETARVAAAQEALESLGADEGRINQYFIRADDIVSFLSGLEATGKALGASVEVASVSADTTSQRPHITLALTITGSFDSVFRTLGAIEYAPYDSRLSSLSLASTPTQSGQPVWTASAVFSIGTKVTTP